jgi:hypothetical protein
VDITQQAKYGNNILEIMWQTKHIASRYGHNVRNKNLTARWFKDKLTEETLEENCKLFY